MAGNLALYPVGEDGACQVDLGEIVETEDVFVISFRSCSKGMQTATAGMAEHGIQGREAVEGFLNGLAQSSGVGNVSREINVRRRRNLPGTENLLRGSIGLEVEQN